ncbi:hypothetical protein [Sphingobium nicotianae]|uniref:DUF3800 domain-containing protein n=1 Tax=Sphingobium nicotianae TaxID=2782607 RepID=A0A9X1DEC0_9SPHN|nr:hypothetical protein [Sphingobium nicotianae]MBT2188627.1 hypothetical protein [Sphingobium nicotianae]
MNANLDAILQDLAAPARVLAFCDETNLTEKPTATLVANLRLQVGIVVSSEVYGPVAEALGTFLTAHGLPEFHATEVVNPKAGTPWRDVPFALRLDAFERLTQALGMAGSRVPYLYLSKQDHDGFVAQCGGLITADYKRSLKTVFLSSMAEYLAAPTPVLVIDRDKNTPGPVLHPIENAGNLLGGGAISVESHKVIGLQIADMAACAVRRYLLKRDAIYAGNGSPFDEVAAQAVASFEGRFELLLDAQPLAA